MKKRSKESERATRADVPNGKVLTLNSLIDNPLLDDQKGVNDAGTFKIICRECDSSIFSDYENPNNYTAKPTQKCFLKLH